MSSVVDNVLEGGPRTSSACVLEVSASRPYPPHLRPLFAQRLQEGRPSSHLTWRILAERQQTWFGFGDTDPISTDLHVTHPLRTFLAYFRRAKGVHSSDMVPCKDTSTWHFPQISYTRMRADAQCLARSTSMNCPTELGGPCNVYQASQVQALFRGLSTRPPERHGWSSAMEGFDRQQTERARGLAVARRTTVRGRIASMFTRPTPIMTFKFDRWFWTPPHYHRQIPSNLV